MHNNVSEGFSVGDDFYFQDRLSGKWQSEFKINLSCEILVTSFCLKYRYVEILLFYITEGTLFFILFFFLFKGNAKVVIF